MFKKEINENDKIFLLWVKHPAPPPSFFFIPEIFFLDFFIYSEIKKDMFPHIKPPTPKRTFNVVLHQKHTFFFFPAVKRIEKKRDYSQGMKGGVFFLPKKKKKQKKHKKNIQTTIH